MNSGHRPQSVASFKVEISKSKEVLHLSETRVEIVCIDSSSFHLFDSVN